MARGFDRSILLASGFAVFAVLGGCSAPSVIDQIPTAMGGEPAGAPARPTASSDYPAVHDMPPPRATPAMNEEQEQNLEKELSAVRDRQEAREAADKKPVKPATKKPSHTAKKKPATNTGQGTGTQDGAKTNP